MSDVVVKYDDAPDVADAKQRIEELRKRLSEDVAPLEDNDQQAEAVADSDDSVSEENKTETTNEIEVNDDTAALRSEVLELKRELSRKGGEYGSELDRLRKSLQLLSEQNDVLIKGFKQPTVEKQEPDKAEDWEVTRSKYLSGISKEAREAFTPEAIDFQIRLMENVAKQQINNVPRAVETRAEDPDIPVLKETIKNMSESNRYIQLTDAIEATAPGFKKANGNKFTNQPADPKWLEFLKGKKDEFETWRDYTERIGTPEVIAHAFNKFKSSSSTAPNTAPNVESQVVPARIKASSSTSDSVQKNYSMADYRAFMEDVKNGKYKASDALDKFEKYKKAALSGRLK